MEELVGAARAVGAERLTTLGLDDHCLGRLFGKIGRGWSNDARGRLIREALGLPTSSTCSLCQGLMFSLDDLAALVVGALEGWDYSTFLMGSRNDPAIVEGEEALWASLGLTAAEPIKAEINREVGKRVEALAGRPADFERPDIVAILDTTYRLVDLQVAPLLVRGRYRKLVRGIPQTRWPCRLCWGKGCPRCGLTGKMYPTSVEEIIAAPIVAMAQGEDHALHGMGREDVDARMLGNGRPFVVEVKRPRRRQVDLAEAERTINQGCMVEVEGLTPAKPSEIQELKEDRRDKSYRVVVEINPPPPMENLKKGVAALEGAEIRQRTPTRVVHRRADKTRGRKVKSMTLAKVFDSSVEIHVRAEAGTYVKELMHGDGGRTTPSLAEALGAEVKVLELDVLGIHDGA